MEAFNLKDALSGDYIIWSGNHIVKGFNAIGNTDPYSSNEFEGFINGKRFTFTRDGKCNEDPSMILEIEKAEEDL